MEYTNNKESFIDGLSQTSMCVGHSTTYGISSSVGRHSYTDNSRALLALEVQKFAREAEQYAKDVSARDYAWYRRAIITALDQALQGDELDEINRS